MMPIPKPPNTIGMNRSGKYGMSRSSVDPYSIAASTKSPPPMISQRGAKRGASSVASTLPTPTATANGRKQIPARSAE